MPNLSSFSGLHVLTSGDSEAFWKRVNKLLKEKKLTQEQAADKIRIPYPTFRGWSHIKKYPNVGDIFELAQVLETSMNYLLFGTNLEPEIQTEFIIGKKVIELLQLLIAVNHIKK